MMNLSVASLLWMLAVPQIAILPDPHALALPEQIHAWLHLVAQKRLPEILKSGDNDLILVRPTKGGAPRPEIVRICMTNRSIGGGPKAFDNHRAGRPRYMAANDHTVCGEIYPTRQDFYFWKTTAGGKLKPVLKQSLNLSDYAGYLLHFEWIND